MLFKARYHAGIADGSITRTIRAWEKPHVKVGGVYRLRGVGMAEVTSVERKCLLSVSDAEAITCGHASRADLVDTLASTAALWAGRNARAALRQQHAAGGGAPPTPKDLSAAAAAARQDVAAKFSLTANPTVFSVAFVFKGAAGSHDQGDDAPDLSPPRVCELERRLQRLDTASKVGPWTAQTLDIIRRRPGVVSTLLAAELGRDRFPFKADVRKLKRLGLTHSLDVGYQLSRLGSEFVAKSDYVKTNASSARCDPSACGGSGGGSGGSKSSGDAAASKVEKRGRRKRTRPTIVDPDSVASPRPRKARLRTRSSSRCKTPVDRLAPSW